MNADQREIGGIGAHMTIDRLTRSDAVRNRERILDTARVQIASHGPDVSMLEIAKAAGVAVGTLYRHYPAKTDLITEIIAEQIDALATTIEQVVAKVESGGAVAHLELRRLISHILDLAAGNPALKTAALALPVDTAFAQRAQRTFTALDRLVAIGREAGTLRPDLSGKDVALLTCTGPRDLGAADRERWLALVWPGLLATSDLASTQEGRSCSNC